MFEQVLRGEIFFADLDPVVGSEQGGIRPVLVIQNNKGNFHSSTIIVLCMSTKIIEKSVLPTHLLVDARSGLKHDSMILSEQIRTIDKRRLLTRLATLSVFEMKKVDNQIMISLDLLNI